MPPATPRIVEKGKATGVFASRDKSRANQRLKNDRIGLFFSVWLHTLWGRTAGDGDGAKGKAPGLGLGFFLVVTSHKYVDGSPPGPGLGVG